MASSLLHNCSDKLPFMDVETILHMKEGLGETSYAQNSSLQASSSPSIFFSICACMMHSEF
ncbi:hypothetical protein ABZP36_017480 [Zizania latifolia]